MKRCVDCAYLLHGCPADPREPFCFAPETNAPRDPVYGNKLHPSATATRAEKNACGEAAVWFKPKEAKPSWFASLLGLCRANFTRNSQ
jgi:hypothetical protein